jgi:hypothetical protein
MSRIYRPATRVLVWLGEAHDESDMLIDFLTNAKGDFGLVWHFPGQSCKPRVELTEEKVVLVRDAFLALCRRPYWRRVWIIQEILSASSLDLLCGTKRLPWALFGPALASLRTTCLYVSVDCSTPAGYIEREWAYFFPRPEPFPHGACRIMFKL